MTKRPVTLALAMPLACVSLFATSAFAQSPMPSLSPPSVFTSGDAGPGTPMGSPAPSARQAPTAAAAGPMPTFQGAPRSLLPPPEPPEVTSFTPDAGRRQEASADPEMVTVAPRAPSSVQPGPVAIPVNESADPEMAPARAIGAPAEVRTVPRSREHKVLPVIMDQAMVVRAPRDVRTMILGNPMIADVASQKGGLIVITGKMYGSTNLLLADAKGRVIGEAMIQVRPPTVDVVTVQLGLQRQSYSCTPQCQPTQVVGNEQSWFASTSGQAQQRSQGMKQ